MSTSANHTLSKSVLVHGPQGCGKSTHAHTIAKALGLRNILDDWQPGAAVPLLDTLVLTNANNPLWHFKGRRMTYAEAMQIAHERGTVA
ncbi:AAA family ATPase [Pseudomonas sp. LS1212]|uniref:AAA family ATPase n=1 Tax=Pseudomonas sp. LS1212 TaxID=2972478 RepID=UPI00215CAA37|nr:AAA family ATPase [Pseudomonas sp. LS1212]UVJ42536.1 AAA family ATPase [Pseudomonas sp. LS1212]